MNDNSGTAMCRAVRRLLERARQNLDCISPLLTGSRSLRGSPSKEMFWEKMIDRKSHVYKGLRQNLRPVLGNVLSGFSILAY